MLVKAHYCYRYFYVVRLWCCLGHPVIPFEQSHLINNTLLESLHHNFHFQWKIAALIAEGNGRVIYVSGEEVCLLRVFASSTLIFFLLCYGDWRHAANIFVSDSFCRHTFSGSFWPSIRLSLTYAIRLCLNVKQ